MEVNKISLITVQERKIMEVRSGEGQNRRTSGCDETIRGTGSTRKTSKIKYIELNASFL